MGFLGDWARKIRVFSAKRGYVCDNCGGEVFSYPAERFCARCEEKLQRNNGRNCEKCGRKTVTEGICLLCKDEVPKFAKGISTFVYEGECASLINRFKNGKRRLAYYFAENMVEDFVRLYGEQMREERFLVVPVPMTESRERARGFNQAKELAEIFTAVLQEKGFFVEFDGEILQKTREIASQKLMDFRARKENVIGAYHVHKRKACRDRRMILIDDIMTTGATGSECADCLYGAGAKEVLFFTATALPERRK